MSTLADERPIPPFRPIAGSPSTSPAFISELLDKCFERPPLVFCEFHFLVAFRLSPCVGLPKCLANASPMRVCVVPMSLLIFRIDKPLLYISTITCTSSTGHFGGFFSFGCFGLQGRRCPGGFNGAVNAISGVHFCTTSLAQSV